MKVLILGGGYAGIFAASNLCKNRNVQVTLVSDCPQLQLLQNIHRVASGELQPKDVTFDIQDILGKVVIFAKGKSEKVDLVAKQVEIVLTESGMEQIIQYDYLIIAIGAKNEYFGIKGARENTVSLRSVDDSIKLDIIIRSLPQDSILTIAGGGATGLSLAGALSEKYGNKIRIRVIEAQKEVLPGWDPVIVEMVKRNLQNKNLEIIRGKPIIEISPQSIILSSGETLQTNVTVWTAGIRGQNLNIIPEVKRTGSGRIIVNKYSLVCRSDNDEVFDNVFAIGDISAFPLDYNGKMSPQLAQFAVRQARNVAKNILRKEDGDEMIELEYLQKGQIISMGTNCIGTLNGFPISGWLCENTEDFVIDNYIRAVLNRGEGLKGRVYDEYSPGTKLAISINFVSYLCRRFNGS
jgi:NADH dehydrogenase